MLMRSNYRILRQAPITLTGLTVTNQGTELIRNGNGELKLTSRRPTRLTTSPRCNNIQLTQTRVNFQVKTNRTTLYPRSGRVLKLEPWLAKKTSNSSKYNHHTHNLVLFSSLKEAFFNFKKDIDAKKISASNSRNGELTNQCDLQF